MLLTITTTHRPATDLSYLLHKHPDRFQSFDLGFGQAHVFYPESDDDRTTAALLLDVDPVAMVRGGGGLADQYVNDRPYVASSFLSVAIGRVFRTAMTGRCELRPDLARRAIPLTARIEALPVRGGVDFVRRVFEPLGYAVTVQAHPLDARWPQWGESRYVSVTLSGSVTLAALLAQLYVLIPVFDDEKHYLIGTDEVEKLLAKGAGWLAAHPEKDAISRRYLGHRANLVRDALDRLTHDEPVLEGEPGNDDRPDSVPGDAADEAAGRPLRLNDQRLAAVLDAIRSCGATSVVDLGCGEGRLLKLLLADARFGRIVGVDVSIRALEIAARRLKLDRLPERQAVRIALLHGSLTYRDERLAGFDAAAIVEVIEHLDPPRLSAFEQVVFEFARPRTVVLTTPNRDYNAVWETLPAGTVRHADHRFEWTRAEFQSWADRVAATYGYAVTFQPVGPVDDALGPPTQMGVFTRA